MTDDESIYTSLRLQKKQQDKDFINVLHFINCFMSNIRTESPTYLTITFAESPVQKNILQSIPVGVYPQGSGRIVTVDKEHHFAWTLLLSFSIREQKYI